MTSILDYFSEYESVQQCIVTAVIFCWISLIGGISVVLSVYINKKRGK